MQVVICWHSYLLEVQEVQQLDAESRQPLPCALPNWTVPCLKILQVVRGYMGDQEAKQFFDSPTPFDILGTGWVGGEPHWGRARASWLSEDGQAGMQAGSEDLRASQVWVMGCCKVPC